MKTRRKSFHLRMISLLLGGVFCLHAQGLSYSLPPAETKVDVGHDTSLLKKLSQGVGAIAKSSKKALVFVSVSKIGRAHV